MMNVLKALGFLLLLIAAGLLGTGTEKVFEVSGWGGIAIFAIPFLIFSFGLIGGLLNRPPNRAD